MSIFGSIMSAIFDHAAPAASAAPATSPSPGAKTPKPAQAPAPTARHAAPSAPSAAPQPVPAAPQPAPAAGKSPVDVTAIMDKLASQTKEKLEWRKSIVDLMKILNLDSSLAARKELAKELHYAGNMHDSASMNVWLHKQVMVKLAEHGGKVPELHTAQTAITDQEAKAWVGKGVYSSDGDKLGEVAAILRAADNKITELRAEIGGVLGLGQHEIALPAGRFSLQNDRIVLDLTAAQAKDLPKVKK
jgi:Domain of unknown function (DUF3597)/PRC-barrel domain